MRSVALKRGYSIVVREEASSTTEIDVIGNYSKSYYNATPIVGKNGVAPTVRENHGQVTAIVEEFIMQGAIRERERSYTWVTQLVAGRKAILFHPTEYVVA